MGRSSLPLRLSHDHPTLMGQEVSPLPQTCKRVLILLSVDEYLPVLYRYCMHSAAMETIRQHQTSLELELLVVVSLLCGCW